MTLAVPFTKKAINYQLAALCVTLSNVQMIEPAWQSVQILPKRKQLYYKPIFLKNRVAFSLLIERMAIPHLLRLTDFDPHLFHRYFWALSTMQMQRYVNKELIEELHQIYKRYFSDLPFFVSKETAYKKHLMFVEDYVSSNPCSLCRIVVGPIHALFHPNEVEQMAKDYEQIIEQHEKQVLLSLTDEKVAFLEKQQPTRQKVIKALENLLGQEPLSNLPPLASHGLSPEQIERLTFLNS